MKSGTGNLSGLAFNDYLIVKKKAVIIYAILHPAQYTILTELQCINFFGSQKRAVSISRLLQEANNAVQNNDLHCPVK